MKNVRNTMNSTPYVAEHISEHISASSYNDFWDTVVGPSLDRVSELGRVSDIKAVVFDCSLITLTKSKEAPGD